MNETFDSSQFSLKLLEMPGLCKKLKLNEEITERITDCKEFGYSPGVLVGNWAEDSAPYTRNVHTHVSSYDIDYTKPACQYDVTPIWDTRLKSQGLPLLLLREHGRQGEYTDNMATVYDLAYRVKAKDIVQGNYGNVTAYGLREMKSAIWKQQKQRNVYGTEYNNSFVSYGKDTYLARKKSVIPRK